MKKVIASLYAFLLLATPLTAFAAEFVDIRATNTGGIKFEIERCANGNVPSVRINGKDYDGDFVEFNDRTDYKIPVGAFGEMLRIEIEPCRPSDKISFKLDGELYTPARAQQITNQINNNTGGDRSIDPPPAGAGNGGGATATPGGDVTTAPGGDVTTAPGGDVTTAPNRLGDPNEIDTVEDVLNVIDRLTNWLFTIFIAAAVIMILIGAFKYLSSGGGEDVAKAHKMLLYAAVAIAVALLAKGVVNVVQSIVTP